jgi:hypothetical protein
VWFVLEDEPGTSWRAATATFSKAAAACSSSSRRVRAARARRRATIAFSSASSTGFEGGGVGGDVSWFGTHAGAEGETLATSLRRRSEWQCQLAGVGGSGGVGVGRLRRGRRPTAAASALRRLRGGCSGR